MSLERCSGKDAITGELVEISFDDAIRSVAPASDDAGLYLAPGFVDLQVNGFAGADYNNPHTAHEEISRSLRAQFACGASRIYPTVITGPPGDMLACLRNLAAARESIPAGGAMDGL